MTDQTRGRVVERWAARLALALSCMLAANLWRQHAAAPEALWTNLDGDRHYHWLAGMQMGLDLRRGDVLSFARDWETVRTWPSLHATLLAVVVAIAGPDLRYAVLPSLAAWTLCGWLVFRLAWGLAPAAPSAARLAGGAVAACAFWSSPAHRAYAVDPMLEALGAALTLWCVDRHLTWRRERTLAAARGLAFALFLLFTAKYNYFLLVLAPMAALEAWTRRRDVPPWLRDAAHTALRPGVAVFWTPLAGWFALNLACWGPKRPSHDQWTYPLYLWFLTGMGWGWRGTIAAHWRALPATARAGVWLLAAPMAAWFALPYRFAYFLYYIGPHNGPTPGAHGLVPGWRFHVPAWTSDYHAGAWALAAAATLAAAGAWAMWSRRAKGETLLLAVLLFAAWATLRHPNLKARMSHSWAPLLWVAGGVGAAAVAAQAGRLRPRLGHAVAGALALGAVAAGFGEFLRPGRSQEHRIDQAHSVVPALRAAAVALGHEPGAVLGTAPLRFAANWAALAAGAAARDLETRVPGFGADPVANVRAFDAWLAKTPAKTVALLDPQRDSAWRFGGFDEYRQFRDLLARQRIFVRVETQRFEHGRCELTVWRRVEEPVARANRPPPR